jgi:excisionase family DNA binding protein
LVELMTTEEVAAYLKLRPETVLRKVKAGQIPAIKIGGRFRFDTKQIDEWLSHSSISRKNILVVDDDPLIGQLFKRTLQRYGYEVTTALNSYEALELFARRRFDVVFLDLVMPGLDGSELFRRLLEIDGHIPVAIMTGYPDSDLMEKAMEQGPFLVMKKPIADDDILKAVPSFTQRMPAKSEETGND